MYFDGSFTLNGVGGGIVLISPKGNQLLYIIQLHFYATNNMAEYQALVNGSTSRETSSSLSTR
jgi:ribonuclease HI